MNGVPEVTVVIPTRDRWPLLSERALPSALAQEDVELEVVVVDDGSRDGTPERLTELADPRIRVLPTEGGRGPSAARNRGIAAARAPWTAFLDDDDCWAPRKLRLQLSVAETTGAAWVYAAAVVVDESGTVLKAPQPAPPEGLAETLLAGNRIWGGPSAVLARTDVLSELGGFDESLRCFEDWDLWLRLAAAAPAAACEEVLVAHLEHAGSTVLRDDLDVLDQHERMLAKHRRVTADDRRLVLEWLAGEQGAAGRRLEAARLYLAAGLRYRSAGNLLAAAGALFGGPGIRTAARMQLALRGRTHLDVTRADTDAPDLPWLAYARGRPGMRRILVVGVPRSGTSWVGQVLGSTRGATYLGEPDNHEHAPFALRAKLGLPGWFYTALEPTREAAAYERLWSAAFGLPSVRTSTELSVAERVRRRASLRLLRTASDEERRHAFQDPQRVPAALRAAAALAVPERPARAAESLVVKSVYAVLALDWIAARFAVDVLVVHRKPLNVLSSWLALGWVGTEAADPLGELEPRVAAELAARLGVPRLEGGASQLAEAAWLIGLLTTAVLDAAARVTRVGRCVSHEELCARPRETFAQLSARLRLEWDARSDALVERLDRPGTGYETRRVAAGLGEAWRDRLTPEQVAEASAALAGFPADSPPADLGAMRG